MKKFIKDWKSLNNQNDPTALDLMRRNRDKYGVPVGTQMRHALTVFWLLPMIYALSKLGEIMGVGRASNGFGILVGLVWVGIVVFALYKFMQEMEKTDPVAAAKREQTPKLVPGVRYHNEVRDGRVVIVDERGHVIA